MELNTEIAQKLFSTHYSDQMPYTDYEAALQKGLSLLHAWAMQQNCSETEIHAINKALEYNMEAMMQPQQA